MKKLSPSGSGYVGVKMTPEMRGRTAALAATSEQSESAVIRAALQLSFALLESHPELVKQLDAGVNDEAMKSLLVRAQAVADKTGTSVLLVLRAGLRAGLFGFERGGEQVDAQFLRFVDMGGFEMPSIQGLFNTMMHAPVMEKAAEAAAVLHGLNDTTFEREAKERGITKEAIQSQQTPASKAKPAKKKPGK